MKNKIAIAAFGLFIFTVAVYSRATNHAFVCMDDGLHITENRWLDPPSLENALEFWKRPYEGLYVPVTYNFWGLKMWLTNRFSKREPGQLPSPRLFHLGNVVLHGFNGVLAFLLLLRLVPGSLLAAAAGALLFAIHPVQVESVAWASGTKDTLAGFFSLLALFFAFSPKPRNVSATIFFLLAVLSKPSAVVLPLLLFLLRTLWMEMPWKGRATWALPATWMVLATPIMLLTRLSQPQSFMRYVPPPLGRFFVVTDTIVFYFSKVLFPFTLVPDYARHPKAVLSHAWGYAGALFLLTFTLWMWKRDRRVKALFVLFVASLLPVLGIVPFFFQFFSTVADRYLYLSMLFPAMGLVWLVEHRTKTIGVCTVGILFGLSLLTFQQVGVWRNNESLFTHLVRHNPNSLLGHNNLGTIYENHGNIEAAAFHYGEALRVYPESLPGLYNLGRMRAMARRNEEAAVLLEKLLKLDPTISEAHYTLGIVYTQLGDFKKAHFHALRAATDMPLLPRAHFQLGIALSQLKRHKEAKAELKRALALDPQFESAKRALEEMENRPPRI